ncbi:ABC transporter ATP-binding protein [Deinococcus sp.]|uniref:ABC transporter ATP-binding protein n=1 Tax=Deinococcus sp. TaxID=47478 RepID=UPI003CC67467
MSAIRVEAASKRFGNVQALNGVSLEVGSGEFLVLLGPSGSGKTTLLRALAGLEPLDAGRLWLGERLVEDPHSGVRLPPEARGLGMVFQEYALWPHLSVLENVALPLRERRATGKGLGGRGTGDGGNGWKARAHSALESVGLAEHLTRYPFELSGGQQQRVALARALAGRPQVLLFDEPLSNLDAKLRDELRLEIARLTREYGITAVYITHDQSEAFYLADRLGIMNGGELVQFGTPEQVYREPASLFVAQFTGAPGSLEASVQGTRLRCGELEMQLPAPPPVQGPVRLALRPEALHVSLQPRPQTLDAEVLHCAYSGSHYQCWLRLHGGQQVLVHIAERLPGGTRVWVGLDPQRLLIFPVSQSGRGAPRPDLTES